MPTHTHPGPSAGPANNPYGPSSAVLVARWLADPATTEDLILDHGLRAGGAFAAVMSRPVKSPELMTALAEVAVSKAYLDTEYSQNVLDVLAEPSLPRSPLLRIAAVVHQLGFNTPALMAALLTHPNSNNDVAVRALWGAGQPLVEKVARATGLLLPLAIAFVSRQLVGVHTPVPNYAITQIHAVHGRWTRWAAQDQSRKTFLLSSALSFTDEDDMFAAGDAFAGQPAHVRP